MTDHFLPGSPPVALVLRRSARARRISLRISQLDGRVTLTVPKSVREGEALQFARDKEGWIRRHLDRRPEDVAVAIGQSLPVEGRLRRITPSATRKVVLSEDEIQVPEAQAAARLKSYLTALARDRLASASDHYAGQLGRSYARISLRDTRSRWGSCSSTGGLMYSWRLILAPPQVLRYVAAHEVAHLAEMNHSPAFWTQVEALFGSYAQERQWLRDNGTALHLFRF